MLAVFLALGTWQKNELISSKQTLLAQSQAALNKARETDNLAQQLRHDYEQLLPLLRQQRHTVDTLQSLALLQHVRSNQSFWFVLFADPVSYFTAQPWGDTNPPPAHSAITNLPTPPIHGFIAELCLPEQGDALRRTLSALVTHLKESQLFQNVDSLPAERRRQLVDPSVLIPEYFTLLFELPEDRLEPNSPATNRPPPDAIANPTTASSTSGTRRSFSSELPASDTAEPPSPKP
jgi:hypothetical protein